MEKEKLETLLIDYIDGKLNDADKMAIDAELTQNAEAKKLYDELKVVINAMDHASSIQPPSSLKTSFDSMLKKEINSSGKGKVVFFSPAFYRVAAAVALVIIGGGLGYLISKYQTRESELAGIRKEMQDTKNMMMALIQNDESASSRIRGVNVAMTIEKSDDQVVKALVKAMNQDPNTNVRLAALEALSKFYNEPAVKKELIESLSTQEDPVVQIALIQLMVKMKEKKIMNDLKRIIDDADAIKPVKDEAYSGIMKLS
jgi:anti-sigma factor RsiW